jgi:hypothetical protein
MLHHTNTHWAIRNNTKTTGTPEEESSASKNKE